MAPTRNAFLRLLGGTALATALTSGAALAHEATLIPHQFLPHKVEPAPVGLPVTAIPEVLSKGVIDANSGLGSSIFARGTQAGADGPARQVAVNRGNNIITVSEEQAKEWDAMARPVYAAWIADMESEGID